MKQEKRQGRLISVVSVVTAFFVVVVGYCDLLFFLFSRLFLRGKRFLAAAAAAALLGGEVASYLRRRLAHGGRF